MWEVVAVARRLEASFPAWPGGPASARAWVRTLDLGAADVDAVTRVVSELAADAVQHAGLTFAEHFTLAVEVDADGVVVSVHDASRTGGPVARMWRTGGLGWTMIRALARDWGYGPGGHSWVRI